MRIVLVNTPIVEKPHYSFRFNEYIQLPLGLLSMAGVLKAAGHAVTIVDAYSKGLTVPETVGRVLAQQPDVVGLTVLTPTFRMASRLAEEIARRRTGGRPLLVMGGAHATLMPVQTLTETCADFVVQGEGERPLAGLAAALEGSRPLESVPGLFFKSGASVGKGPANPSLEDLDQLPPLDYTLLDMGVYKGPIHLGRSLRTYGIMTTRGCLFDCPFCAGSRLYQGVGRHSIPRIHREIETLAAVHGCQRLIIFDAIFPTHRERGLQFLAMMRDSGLHRRVRWHIQTRVELLDEEFVAKAKAAGCEQIALGIESGDPGILRSIHKRFSPAEAIRVSKLIRHHGIRATAGFIFGHIGETRESMERTIQLARSMDLDDAAFFFMMPYPGTRTLELARADGHWVSDDWDRFLRSGRFMANQPVFVPKGLTAEQITDTRRRALMGFNLSPKTLWRSLKRMGPACFALKYLLHAASWAEETGARWLLHRPARCAA